MLQPRRKPRPVALQAQVLLERVRAVDALFVPFRQVVDVLRRFTPGCDPFVGGIIITPLVPRVVFRTADRPTRGRYIWNGNRAFVNDGEEFQRADDVRESGLEALFPRGRLGVAVVVLEHVEMRRKRRRTLFRQRLIPRVHPPVPIAEIDPQLLQLDVVVPQETAYPRELVSQPGSSPRHPTPDDLDDELLHLVEGDQRQREQLPASAQEIDAVVEDVDLVRLAAVEVIGALLVQLLAHAQDGGLALGAVGSELAVGCDDPGGPSLWAEFAGAAIAGVRVVDVALDGREVGEEETQNLGPELEGEVQETD